MEQVAVWVYRWGEVMLNSAPTLLAGVILGGLITALTPAGVMGQVFGSGRGLMSQSLRGVLAGMIAPVCSVGVIPLAMALWRRGVGAPAVIAVLLTGGAVNPWSVAYGATLAPVWVVALLAGCVAAMGLLGGLMAGTRPPAAHLPDPPPASLRGAIVAAAGLAWSSLPFVLVATAGVATAATVVPAGFLNEYVIEQTPWQPAVLAAVMLPAWASPELGMMNASHLSGFNVQPGSAAVYLTMGAGLNLGVLLLGLAIMGLRRGALTLATTLGVVLILAYATGPLLRSGPPTHEDTHGLDVHATPFHLARDDESPWVGVQTRLGRLCRERPLLPGGVATVALLTALGASPGLRRPIGGTAPPPSSQDPRRLTGRTVATLWTVGLGGWAALTVTVLYPEPRRTITEMRLIDAELAVAIRRAEPAAAQRHLTSLDRLAARLGPGAALRPWAARPVPAAKVTDQLARLRAAVDRADWPPARELSDELSRTLRDAGRQ